MPARMEAAQRNACGSPGITIRHVFLYGGAIDKTNLIPHNELQILQRVFLEIHRVNVNICVHTKQGGSRLCMPDSPRGWTDWNRARIKRQKIKRENATDLIGSQVSPARMFASVILDRCDLMLSLTAHGCKTAP